MGDAKNQFSGALATNGVAYVCAGWNSTGSVPASGTGNTATFTISSNSTLTWNWVPFTATGSVLLQSSANYLQLSWPGVSGALYDVYYSATAGGPFNAIVSDLAPTPPQNNYQIPMSGNAAGFYRIRIK